MSLLSSLDIGNERSIQVLDLCVQPRQCYRRKAINPTWSTFVSVISFAVARLLIFSPDRSNETVEEMMTS